MKTTRGNEDRVWQLQDAKARFSEVFRRARTGAAQVVTRHGSEAVVIVRAEDFERLQKRGRKKDLVRFFAESPLAGSGINLDRDRDYGRSVEL